MNGICIIVGAGDFSEAAIAHGENDLIIAADGGMTSLEKIGIVPDVIIGDFDSACSKPVKGTVITLPCEKEVTDTAAAVELGLSKGYKKFRIFGGTGGRDEHTIANIQNIVKLTKNGCFAEIVDENKVITSVCNGKISFDKTHKGFISVFSHSDLSEGVYEKGLKYSLENVTLTNTEPLGISNEFMGRESEIIVKKGILLIIYDRQKG